MKITLATLPEATAQQVFDQVAVHLLTQGEVCKSANGVCVYRLHRSDGKTLRCAAGDIISDEEYDARNQEGCRFGNQFEEIGQWNTLVHNKLVPDSHSELIRSLQRIHDTYNPSEWRITLIRLAKSEGLNTNAIDALRCGAGTIELPGKAFTLWTTIPRFNAFKMTEFSN